MHLSGLTTVCVTSELVLAPMPQGPMTLAAHSPMFVSDPSFFCAPSLSPGFESCSYLLYVKTTVSIILPFTPPVVYVTASAFP